MVLKVVVNLVLSNKNFELPSKNKKQFRDVIGERL